jgi:hypothetical protein
MIAVIGLVLLLLIALLGGWAYVAAPDDAGLRGTVWKHQTVNTTITLEFGRLGHIVGNPVVRYTSSKGSASTKGSTTYSVLDPKTLSLASGEKLVIDSISSDNLVLSGGPWKLDKAEFTRWK